VSLAADLLEQADHLARREQRRPKQASLRRAISSAYYSLFHLIVEDASRFLVAGSQLRVAIARSFDHQAVRAAASAMVQLSRTDAAHWLRTHVADPMSKDLTFVCDVFLELQEQRHRADYDVGASFFRFDANAAVSSALNAHGLWRAVRGSPNAQAFMLVAAKLLRTR
jgi:hypothetical protein